MALGVLILGNLTFEISDGTTRANGRLVVVFDLLLEVMDVSLEQT